MSVMSIAPGIGASVEVRVVVELLEYVLGVKTDVAFPYGGGI